MNKLFQSNWSFFGIFLIIPTVLLIGLAVYLAHRKVLNTRTLNKILFFLSLSVAIALLVQGGGMFFGEFLLLILAIVFIAGVGAFRKKY